MSVGWHFRGARAAWRNGLTRSSASEGRREGVHVSRTYRQMLLGVANSGKRERSSGRRLSPRRMAGRRPKDRRFVRLGAVEPMGMPIWRSVVALLNDSTGILARADGRTEVAWASAS